MANERRLIDATEAETWAAEHILDVKERYTILDFLRECSTVDAVEVVRCKNCKYWEPIRYGYRTDGLCLCLSKYHDAERPGTEGDFYCAYGKKRESGTQPQREDV